MKKLVLWAICGLAASQGYAQFQHSYGTPRREVGNSLCQLREVEEGYLIAGYTDAGFINPLDATLVRTDPAGNQLWSRVYGGHDSESFNSVRQARVISPNYPVAYVVAGLTRSFGFGSEDAMLIGTDSNGFPVFSKVYGGENSDRVHCIQNAVDEHGEPGYIMVGETNSYPWAFPGSNVYVIQTDLFGNLKRATVIGGEGNQRGLWIEQTKDGGYIIAGSTTNYRCQAEPAPPVDIFVIRLRPDLSMAWNRIIGYPGALKPVTTFVNEGTCVKETSSGQFVVTGYTNSFGINHSQDVFLLSLSAAGGFNALKTYGTERDERASSLVENFSPDGVPVYTVLGQSNISSPDALMLQTNAALDLQWVREYGRDGDEAGKELTLDYSDGYAFTGYTTSLGTGSPEIYLVETDLNGFSGTVCEEELWLEEIRHDPCIVSSAQQVFVEGELDIQPEVIEVFYEEDICGAAGFRVGDQSGSPELDQPGIELFPNPAGDRLTLKFIESLEGGTVRIISMEGREMMHKKLGKPADEITLATEALKSGMYFVELRTLSGEIRKMKFIRE